MKTAFLDDEALKVCLVAGTEDDQEDLDDEEDLESDCDEDEDEDDQDE